MEPAQSTIAAPRREREREPIAIVGIAAMFPKASTAEAYWKLVLEGADGIGDVPPTHWLVDDYFDADPKARDKVYARRGGFLSPIAFDLAEWGIPPALLSATDPSQLLALVAARACLEDAAGRDLDRLDRRRVSVILGATGLSRLATHLGGRTHRAVWARALREAGLGEDQVQSTCDRIASRFVEWSEGSFPGLLANVIAGRIANRLDLGGTNLVTDAACGSGLAAVLMAARELWLGDSDLVVTGGVDTMNNPFMFTCFSKTPALSPSQDCRPFSAAADGTLLGEGLGMLALERLSDAERNDHRIYALLRSVGTSSDGRLTSIYAPAPSGQAAAIRRAHEQAGVDPGTVELIEAHGTGTAAGDAAEWEGLRAAFAAAVRPDRPWCALGSVKSQIGHTKAAAGAAGLIKAALAIRHGVLPRTLKVDAPNPKLDLERSPFYLATRNRPWIRDAEHGRRAGVSSFGFGGANFHALVEEYRGARRAPRMRVTPDELVVLSAESVEALARRCEELASTGIAPGTLAHLAHASQRAADASHPARLAIVAADEAALAERLAAALPLVREGEPSCLAAGVYLGVGPRDGEVAYLFPGQGSQYVGMGAELAMAYDEARRPWDLAAGLRLAPDARLHEVVFPPPRFDPRAEAEAEARVTATEWAQPAIAAASLSWLSLLQRLGVRAAAAAGHSFGELTALHAAGALGAEDLLGIARRRGELMRDAAGVPGAMTAVVADVQRVRALVEAAGADLVVANHNAPAQVVVSGATESIARLEDACARAGVQCRRLPVACAFHSPLVAASCGPLAEALAGVRVEAPGLPVLAGATASPYPPEPSVIREMLAQQVALPVRFVDVVEAMYARGIRTFVELGPSSVLSGLVARILEGRPFTVVSLDQRGRHAVSSLHHAVGALHAAGVPMTLGALWHEYRVPADPSAARASRFTVPIDGAIQGDPYPTRDGPTGASSLPPDARPTFPPAAPPVSFPASADAVRDARHDGRTTMRDDTSPRRPQLPAAAAGSHGGASGPGTAIMEPAPALPSVDASGPHAPAPGAAAPPAPAASRRNGHAPAQPRRAIAPPPGGLAVLDPARPADASLVLRQIADAHVSFQTTMAGAHAAFHRAMAESHAAFLSAALGGPARLPAEPSWPPPADPRDVAPHEDALADAPHHAYDDGEVAVEVPAEGVPALVEAAVLEPAAPVARPAVSAGPAAVADPSAIVLSVVAEKTGYPHGMLRPEMDLEGDLGVDSLKRVEILAALAARMPSLDPSPAAFAGLRTLKEITAAAAALPAPAGPAVAAPDAVAVTGPHTAAARRAAVAAHAVAVAGPHIAAAARRAVAAHAAAVTASPRAPAEVSARRDERGGAGAGPITDAVLSVVAEKTGYPPQMLALGMSLEADLGVDSLKRVEILTALAEHVPAARTGPAALANPRTIGDIVRQLAGDDLPPSAGAAGARGGAAHPPEPAAPARDVDPAEPDDGVPFGRFSVRSVPSPASGLGAPGLREARRIAVTDDRTEVAPAVVAGLQRMGLPAELVRGEVPADADAVLFLGGLRPAATPDDAIEVTREAFLAARRVAPSFGSRGGVFVAVQDAGGAPGGDGDRRGGAWVAGVAGVVKSARWEWPLAHVKTIVLERGRRTTDELAEAIQGELRSGGPDVEVELRADGTRAVPVLVREDAPEGELVLGREDIVVVSGGARGVTAAGVIALARRAPCRLLLLGRTELEEEPEACAGATGEAELNERLLEQARRRGEPVTPLDLGARARRILAVREIRATLRALAEAGATARYAAVDVTDAGQVARAIAEARASWGAITAVIHGAGVLADRLLADKTPEQFDRVLSTKVLGLSSLLRATGDDPLRALVVFSSLSGRLGCAGQCDYAAANDMLSRIVRAEAERRAGLRAWSLAWGPWRSGMVGDALARRYEAAGIPTVAPEEGGRWLVQELGDPGAKGREVVLGARHAALGETGPVTAGEVRVTREAYPHVQDHRIKGTFVVPLVQAVEWLARLGRAVRPDLAFAGCDDLQVLRGIKLAAYEAGGDVLRLVARPAMRALRAGGRASIPAEIAGAGTAVHYRAAIALRSRLDAPSRRVEEPAGLLPVTSPVYGSALFHGPRFHALQVPEIRVGAAGATAALRGGASLGWDPAEPWITDPALLDGALQLMGLWLRHRLGAAAVPTRLGALRVYRHGLQPGALRAVLTGRDVSSHRGVADIVVLDGEGGIVAELEGAEAHAYEDGPSPAAIQEK